MVERFKARSQKTPLVFSAAHFITFNGNVCERLHGHNWRLDVTITGPLDDNYYVFDFIALRDACQRIAGQLDHKVLLPDRHGSISVETISDGREVIARFEDRRWVFPAEDCAILPIENTTAELIARWVGHSLLEDLKLREQTQATELKVSVEENFGRWATVTIAIERGSAK